MYKCTDYFNVSGEGEGKIMPTLDKMFDEFS